MRLLKYIFLPFYSLAALSTSCKGQTNNQVKMNTDTTKTNPLICDPAEGICGVPANEPTPGEKQVAQAQSLKLVYFTDPICSSCWGIEPQLRKLKLEYGADIAIEYRMGGLLPDWSYNSGGISKPSDVAHHWDEVSGYYDMPIDGDVWLEDPLSSSYPPSIAFKAAQLQDDEKAILFMREMRELVFLEKKNIAKWEHMATAAKRAGLDPVQLKKDYEGKAVTLFEEDLKLAREYGVRGFPTMFFSDAGGKQEMVYGSKPYPFYETAILTVAPQVVKKEYDKDWHSLFGKYSSLTAKEFAELSGTPRKDSESVLDGLVGKGLLTKLNTKNGAIWRLKK